MTDKAARKKSETRQRRKQVKIRWLEQEFNDAAAKAQASGLSFAAYVRAAATGDAGPRARRRSPVDAQIVRQALALHGRYGNNMNQIAYQLNAGHGVDMPELRRALQEWGEIRDLMLEALSGVCGGRGAPPAEEARA